MAGTRNLREECPQLWDSYHAAGRFLPDHGRRMADEAVRRALAGCTPIATVAEVRAAGERYRNQT